MFAAWFTEIVLITLRDLNISFPGSKTLALKSQGHTVNGLPLPADYLATFVVFAPLALLADTRAKNVATALGWGLVIATLLNATNATNPAAKSSSSSTSAQ